MALMPVGLAATASWFGRYLLRTLCADAVVGPELALVPFLALALLAKGEQQYTAGTFVRKTGTQGKRMTKILERADLLRTDVYAAPPWYFGGDVATIWSAAMTSWPGAPPPRRCVGIRGDRMLQCSVCRLRALRGDARPWHSLEVVTDDTSSGCTCLYWAAGTSCSIFLAPTSSSTRQRCATVTLLLLRHCRQQRCPSWWCCLELARTAASGLCRISFASKNALFLQPETRNLEPQARNPKLYPKH